MRQTKNRVESTLPISGLRGLIAGFAAIIVLLAIASIFVSKGLLPEDMMRITVAVCAFIGGLAGGLIAAKSFGRRLLPVGAGVGAVMFFVCLVTSAISRTADFPSMWHLLLAAVLIGGGTVGGMIAARTPSRRR